MLFNNKVPVQVNCVSNFVGFSFSGLSDDDKTKNYREIVKTPVSLSPVGCLSG